MWITKEGKKPRKLPEKQLSPCAVNMQRIQMFGYIFKPHFHLVFPVKWQQQAAAAATPPPPAVIINTLSGRDLAVLGNLMSG